MKRVGIVSILLSAIIFISVLGLLHLRNVKDDLMQTSDTIISAIEKEDKQKVTEYIEQLEYQWEKYNDMLYLYVRHEKLDNVNNSIAKLNILTHEEYYVELSSEIHLIKSLLRDIWDDEKPSFISIFG